MGPVGWVQMRYKGILEDLGFNLVVAQGREFAAQKLFNTISYDGGTVPVDMRDRYISHFAIGGGGATCSGDTFVLTGPTVCDTHLYKAITLGSSSYLNEPHVFTQDGVFYYQDAVKLITASGGSTYLESVTYTGGSGCSYYTRVKNTCIIPSGEPQGLDPGASVPVSEAGLYMVEPDNGSYFDTALLFAHICFPPKWKEKESELQIIWYVLF